jgi:hypothetical protein
MGNRDEIKLDHFRRVPFKWQVRRARRVVGKRVIRPFRSGFKWLAILVFLAIAALFFWHLTVSGTAGGSARMIGSDFRVFVECPTSPEIWWRFIGRTEMEALGVGAEAMSGTSIPEAICHEGLMDRLPTTLSELLERVFR